MENREIKNIFDTVELSRDEKERLWEQIDKKVECKSNAEEKSHGKSHRKFRGKIRVGRVAAAILLLMVSAAGLTNVITNGKLTEAMEKILHMSDSSRQIIKEVSDYHVKLDSVYAPQVVDYNNNRLIFGGVFGLVVYDCKTERVVGTMDLEKIGCNFFNADTVQTHFYVEDNQLLIYNRKIQSKSEVFYSSTYSEYPKQKKLGKCYRYDLSECDRAALDSVTVVEMKPEPVETVDKKTDKKWREYEVENFWKNYTYWKFDHADSYFHQNAYSEYCKTYTDESGEKCQACLVLDDGTMGYFKEEQEKNYQLFLCCQRESDKKTDMKKLNISLSVSEGDKDKTKLPDYEYPEDSEIGRALVRCFYEEPKVYAGTVYGVENDFWQNDDEPEEFSSKESDLVVPIIRIAAVKKGKKYTKVFGTLRWAGFTLSGKTLYESNVNGGSEGVAYLKKTEDGYKVEKVILPHDGGLREKDLLELTDGDKKIVKKMDLTEQYDELVGEILRGYVAQNQLDIHYYKSFGWDPIDISVDG